MKVTPLFLLILPVLLLAQPEHTVLMYSDPLDSPGSTQFAEFTNRDGNFIAGKGWEATSNTSQLFIKVPEDLPNEGTFVINVTNFDPVSQNQDDKQQIINLYSQRNGSKEIFNSDGSWWNIRTGYPYSTGTGRAGFKFLAAARGIDTRDEERCIEDKSDWDLNHQYEFKVIWTTDQIYCYLDDQLMSVLPFQGQVQHFQYIFIGTDNVYTAQPGPIYSNLRIYSTEEAIDAIDVSFSDVTKTYKAGGIVGYGHGVSFADVDQDNFYDIFVGDAVRDLVLPDQLFMNQGGTWFSEQAAQRGVSDMGLTHSITTGDIDNDGDLDAFFADMSVYEDKHGGFGRNELYRNDGGNFTDVTNWGISNEENDTRGAIMLDINNDGWLDIYGVNWGQACEMYLNQGNGHFERVDRGADGPDGDNSSKQGVTAADFDNDGDIDIYVSRRDAGNWLFVNDGNGYFTERAEEYGVDMGGRSHGATFADIDNDGDLDLFVVNYAYTSGDLPHMGVFINNGDGSFTDKTKEYDIRVSGYSVAFGDVDNDADLDMFLAFNNDKDPGAVPRLYVNNGAGKFTMIECGVEVQTKDPRGLGYGDIDNDGDIDFYIACKDGQNYLLQNDYSGGNHYIDVLCIGPQGDYGGFGSKVTVYEPGHLGDPSRILGYQESTANYAYLCQNQTALHFGLREFTSCDIRIVRTDGRIFDYSNVPADQVFEMEHAPMLSYSLVYVSGNDQTGTTGQPLAEPFVVRLLDADHQGVAAANVTFAPQNGGGMVEPQPVTTDADGYARSTFVLGQNEGAYEIWATSEKSGAAKVIFQAQAAVPDTLYLKYVSGDNQTGEPGQQLAEPFVVRVQNSNGQGVAQETVVFTPQNGGAMIDSMVVTDADGYARSTFVLGDAEGDYVVIARCDTTDSTVTFHARAEFVHNNITIIKNYGDAQSGVVGKTLDSPLVVKAVDDQGRAVPGVDVEFSTHDGSMQGDTLKVVTTDEEGKARVVWTLGLTTGEQRLYARYGETELMFTATAQPDAPAALEKIAPEDSAYQAGKSYTFQCAVFDKYENPVPEANVLFTVISGHGDVQGDSAATVAADSAGIASAMWRLGYNHNYHNVLQAAIVDMGEIAPVTFEIDSVAPPLLDKSTVTSSKDSVAADGMDAAKIVIILKDEEGHPLPDYAVQISVTGDGNIIEPLSEKSDSAGVFKALLKSVMPGEKTVSAEVPGVGKLPDTAIILFTPPTPDKMYLVKVSGDSQTAVVARTLPAPFVVQVINAETTPLPGEKVVFEVKNNLGRLGEGWKEIVASNDSGFAEIYLTLGEHAGLWNHLVVAYIESDSNGVEFRATALPDTAAVIAKTTGDSLTVMSGDTLTLGVRVGDLYDNPISGAALSFTSDADDVFLTEMPVLTDAAGEAEATLVVGETLGAHTVHVSMGAISTDFTVFVSPVSEHLVYVSPDTVLIDDLDRKILLQARCLDPQNRPIAGISATFRLVQGAGEFTQPTTVQSDSNGLVETSWRPGTLQETSVIRVATAHDSLSFFLVPRAISFVAQTNIPGDFALLDNYPNPFNPSTAIPFVLPHDEIVSLQVFDVSGRLVRTLVDGRMSAGEHVVVFDALNEAGESIPSGIYFYQLKAGSFKAIKRLLLVK